MQYYKVVESINSPVIIDTQVNNYGSVLIDRFHYEKLLSYITHSSLILDLPLDMYFSLNNNLYILREKYLINFPKPVNGKFEVSAFTNLPIHKGIFINESDLNDILENLILIGLPPFFDGFYLWEYLYEKVRINKHIEKPSRTNSFFLFENLSDCNFYIDNHKPGYVICKVDILNKKCLFKGDMNLLDLIPNHYTFKQSEAQIDNYWKGYTSQKPVYEILFQGICKLIPL